MIKKIKVRIPATSANLGPGFDVLGVALNLYNEIEVKLQKNEGINIQGEGKDTLPKDERNIVWQAMNKVFNLNSNKKYSFNDLHISLINRIPLASGLGSSAAARLGGILAANAISKKKLSLEDILNLGVELEGHPDNIVPAMIGGFCVSTIVDNKVKYIKLPFRNIKTLVCTPDFELNTDESREFLPENITVSNAIFNLSRLAFLLSAFQMKKYDLLNIAMQDKIHQPYRSSKVPGMKDIFETAVKSGAYGVALSGGGPSIIAFCPKTKIKKVGQSMRDTWRRLNINSNCFVLDFDLNGAKIVKG